MTVDSHLFHVLISKLSVGSRYEISVRSIMGATESEAITASVVTGKEYVRLLHAYSTSACNPPFVLSST